MDNKFRNQLLAESKKKEEELKDINLEIEERAVSKKGPFVLIRNKNNKWVITTCGALVLSALCAGCQLALVYDNREYGIAY